MKQAAVRNRGFLALEKGYEGPKDLSDRFEESHAASKRSRDHHHVIAQTGRYPQTAPPLDKGYVVEGEQRYWVHLAIDRYTVFFRFLKIYHSNPVNSLPIARGRQFLPLNASFPRVQRFCAANKVRT